MRVGRFKKNRPLTDTYLQSFAEKIAAAQKLSDIFDDIFLHKDDIGATRFLYRQKIPDGKNFLDFDDVHQRGCEDLIQALKQDDDNIRQVLIGALPINLYQPQPLEELLRTISGADDALIHIVKSLFPNGWIFPVYGTCLRNGFYIFSFVATPKFTTIANVQCMVQAAHLALCKIKDQNSVIADLSTRELTVMHWVSRGKNNKEIGQIMDISPHTVNGYLRQIFLKTETSDRTSSVIKLMQTGILS